MAESRPETSVTTDPPASEDDNQEKAVGQEAPTDPPSSQDNTQEKPSDQEVDQLICSVTQKRKVYPQKITKQLSKRLRTQAAALDNYAPVLESSLVFHEDLSQTDDERLVNRCRDSVLTLGKQIKTMPALIAKTERIKEVLCSGQSAAVTKTDRVLFRPHKDEAKMAASLTPLRKQLARSPAPTPSPRPSRRLLLEDRVASKGLRKTTASGYVLRPKN